jgi:DNA-binding SARP family transcriptional activator
MNNNKCFTRDYLGNLLWPGSSRKATYSNLRYNLWKINNVFEKYYAFPVINSKNDRIAFCEGIKYTLDIENLRSFLHQDSLPSVKSVNMIYPGDFLEGFYLKKCLDYNDWIFYERESIQRLYYEILEELLKKYKNKNLFYESIDILKTMLKINPFNEILYQEIIEMFLKKGDKTDALNYYNKCVNTLRENLNISPKKSTRELLGRIKNSRKEKERNLLDLDIFCKDYVQQNFYYINELLKQVYQLLGKELINQVEPKYLCEISKLSLVYENLFDKKEIREVDDQLKNIRLLDAIEAYFLSLSQLYRINIGISNYESIDQKTRIMIERIKTIENIEVEIK